MRSLSLTRSSEAPRTVNVRPSGIIAASAASAGISSITPGTSPGATSKLLHSRERQPHGPHRFPRAVVIDRPRHARARASEHVEHGDARRIQSYALDLDGGPGRAAGQRGPECRAGDIPRHRQGARFEPLARGDLDGRTVANHGDAERFQRAFRMIPRRRRLDDPGAAGRMQARQQDAALDLGAGHLRFIHDPLEAAAVDGQRRAAARRVDSRAHARERLDDSAHGPPLQRVVAADHRPKRMSREDPGQEPNRGP